MHSKTTFNITIMLAEGVPNDYNMSCIVNISIKSINICMIAMIGLRGSMMIDMRDIRGSI